MHIKIKIDNIKNELNVQDLKKNIQYAKSELPRDCIKLWIT